MCQDISYVIEYHNCHDIHIELHALCVLNAGVPKCMDRRALEYGNKHLNPKIEHDRNTERVGSEMQCSRGKDSAIEEEIRNLDAGNSRMAGNLRAENGRKANRPQISNSNTQDDEMNTFTKLSGFSEGLHASLYQRVHLPHVIIISEGA